MAIPEQTILEIKYKNDIESVIAPYVNLKRAGKNLKGLCPFHNEKTPSFTVYPENGSFYCFGCQVGGDVFTFTKLINNLDYIEAVRLLAEKSGVNIDDDGYDNSIIKQKQTVLEINRETARFFHSFLMSPGGKWALDYLMGRGLTLKTIKHFGLGAAPDTWSSLCDHLKSKGFSYEDMLIANVVSKSSKGSYYDRFRNRVMFPLIDLRGNVLAFSGRRHPDVSEGGKYINSSDTPVYKKSQHLFGMNFAKNCCEERIIVVEGNMDAVSIQQAGFENAVALFGTALSQEQIKLLSRYTKEIVFALDADAAGQNAVKKAIDAAKESGVRIRILRIPEGKDPDEFIKTKGAASFKALIDGAVDDLEYNLLMIAQNIDTQDDSGRLQYLKEATKILATSYDKMAIDLYTGRLSEKYGVSKETLLNSVNEHKEKLAKQKYNKEISDIITPKFSYDDPNPQKRANMRACSAEEKLISVLLKHQDLIDKAKEELPPEKMVTDLNRLIYKRIISANEKIQTVDFSVLGDGFSPAEMGYLVSLQNALGAGNNAQLVLKDCIKVILEEDTRKNGSNLKNLSVEDWATKIKELADKKHKGE